jgi:integrase
VPRQATMPIPEEIREAFFLALWDLAYSGRIQTPQVKWGTGHMTYRRHGLVCLWLTMMAGRFSDVRSLRVTDLYTDAVYLARSKHGRRGMVTVGRPLVELTIAWRTWFVSSFLRCDTDLLFPSCKATALSTDVFNRDVAGPLGRAFGFRLSSHCFRDTSCQLHYAQTQNIRAVQAALGHQAVSSTEHYLAKQQAAARQLLIPGSM